MPQGKILKHCKILGFDEMPTQKNLKAGYRELIKKWHPDRHSNDSLDCEIATKKAQEINEAFEFISEILETFVSTNFSSSLM